MGGFEDPAVYATTKMLDESSKQSALCPADCEISVQANDTI